MRALAIGENDPRAALRALSDVVAGGIINQASPEYIYVLGFSLHSLKPNGRMHSLKATLLNAKGLTA